MAVEGFREYVRYIYALSLTSAFAVTLVTDYVLTSLLLFGEAHLQPLVLTPILMFIISTIILTALTVLRQFRGDFSRLQGRHKAFMCVHALFIFVALGYFAYTSTIHYMSLDLTIRSPQLIGDHYLGFGLALFNAGLIAALWKLLESHDVKSRLLKAFKPFISLVPGFKGRSKDEDDFIDYVK